MRSKKALSPVIATVILVAVTIVVAVSVAYWMGTIASSYTTFEQIEMPTSYAEYNETGNYWNVTVQLKNTGSADATVTEVSLNDIPLDKYTPALGSNPPVPISVNKGQTVNVWIEIPGGTEGCDHGVRVNFKFRSAAGQNYPLLVKLP